MESSRCEQDVQLAQSASAASPQAVPNANVEGHLRSSPTLYLAVAIQGLNGGLDFHRIPVRRTEHGEQVWTSVRQHVFNTLVQRRLSLWASVCFIDVVVGTGTIQEPHALVPTPPNDYNPMNFRNYRRDQQLTDAFRNPTVLAHDTNYVAENERFVVRPSLDNTELNGQDVIVIQKYLNKTRIAWLLIVLLIISPILGLAVGVYTHKPAVGIAVSAGVFALASFLQGLAAWFGG